MRRHFLAFYSAFMWTFFQTPIRYSNYLSGHSEEIFSNPLEFKPERWLNTEKSGPHPYASIPFGFGRRMCIGRCLFITQIYCFCLVAGLPLCSYAALSPHVREQANTVLDWIPPPWIPDSRYWIPVFVSGTLDSGFLVLYSGFQNPGFRIPQEKISRFRNPDSLTRGSVVSWEDVLSVFRIKVAPWI